ncbi:MAG TPA: thiamine pyrophosphate-binding protein [Bacilli bacterium]
MDTEIQRNVASRRVAEAILEQLDICGVRRVYGVVGDAIFGLMDAISRQSAIRFVAVKHESVAALMASAEAKCTGNMGVCAAQAGPGLANLLNGLGAAFLDGVPVLAITGQVPGDKIGTRYKQYIHQQELVRAVTGFSELAVHPDAVMRSLTAAVRTAKTLETAAHLAIPADVWNLPTVVPPGKPASAIAGAPDTAQLEQILEVMRQAKRPMIMVGPKARPAAEAIGQLAEAWGSGIALGYGATGVMPDSAPLALGGLGEGGNPYLTGRFKQADAVLLIETDWWPDGQTPTEAIMIRIVGSQAKLATELPVAFSIVGDPALIAAYLAKELALKSGNAGWVRQLKQCKQTWAEMNEREGLTAVFPFHPSRIIRAIERSVAPDAVIAVDEGDSTLWFLRNFRARRQRILLSENWRTMGYGLPAALAAKCCLPQRQVVCITGDGGLAMVLADLLTAVRYRLNIVVIVLNNGSLQMERNKMTARGLNPEGTQVINPDFVKLAESCGWSACRVEEAEDLERLLRASLASSKPVLLDVPTAQAPYPDYPLS